MNVQEKVVNESTREIQIHPLITKTIRRYLDVFRGKRFQNKIMIDAWRKIDKETDIALITYPEHDDRVRYAFLALMLRLKKQPISPEVNFLMHMSY